MRKKKVCELFKTKIIIFNEAFLRLKPRMYNKRTYLPMEPVMNMKAYSGAELTPEQFKNIKKSLTKLESSFSKGLKYSVSNTQKTFGYYGECKLEDGSLYITSKKHSPTLLTCFNDLMLDIKKQHRDHLRVNFSNQLFAQISSKKIYA